jgi:hypothetical protein
VFCGVGCTVLFAACSAASQAGWIRSIVNVNYASIFNNLVMFAVCWFTALFFRARHAISPA